MKENGQHMDTVIIGIAGGTGSGKITLAECIRDDFGGNYPIVSYDNSYRPQDGLHLRGLKKSPIFSRKLCFFSCFSC